MPWGDDDPTLVRPKSAQPAAQPGWGDEDPALKSGKPKRKSFGLGFDEGLARPIDNLATAMDTGLKTIGVPIDKINAALGQPTTAETIARRRAKFAEKEQELEPSGVGKVAGGLFGTAPVLAATRNPWLAGGAQGALLSEAKDPAGVAIDAAGGALLNKAGGMVMDKLGGALKPAIDPAVKLLRDAGVRLTPGQVQGGKAMVREDKAMSRPIVGERIAADRTQGIEDFNRGAVNRALLPLGVRLPDNVKTGHDAVAFMQDVSGKAFDGILPKMKLTPDARLAAGYRKAMSIAAELPEKEAELFNTILTNRLRFDGGEMTGRRLAVAVRGVKAKAAAYSRSGDEAERGLGEALSHMDDAMMSALGAQNAGFRTKLSAANLAYRGNRIVSDSAKMADEGVASTGQLKSAVRQNDRSKNQRKTAAGQAHMQDYAEAGRKVLPAKTPDSGTAGRLQSDKWIPNIRGAIDTVGYKANKAYTDYLLAERPEVLKRLGGLLEDYRPQGGFLASGLFGRPSGRE